MSSDRPRTRERILQATWDLMEQCRGRGVRMQDVAAGVSRQAVYLHFPSRAELMIATLRYGDEVRGIEQRLAAFRAATTGVGRLDAFVAFWAEHVPLVYGIASALLAARDTDEAVAAAWEDRMATVREGCRSIVTLLESEGRLVPDLSVDEATDLLWTLLSIRNWDSLVQECGWSTQAYVAHMQALLVRALVARRRGRRRFSGTAGATAPGGPGQG